MNYLIVREMPRQNSFQHIKAYKSASGAKAFLEKNPQYTMRKVKATAAQAQA
jgi:hypothetical protein